MLDKSNKILDYTLEVEKILNFFRSVQKDFSLLFEENHWVLSWWYFIPIFVRKRKLIPMDKLFSQKDKWVLLEKVCQNVIRNMDNTIRPLLLSLENRSRFLTHTSLTSPDNEVKSTMGAIIDNNAYTVYLQNGDLLLIADDIYAQCKQLIPLLKQGIQANNIAKKLNQYQNIEAGQYKQIINHAADLYQKVSAIGK